MAVLTRSLNSLKGTFDRAAPNRDKTSDGWIGNELHAASVSSHNPDETGNVPVHDADTINEVHAIDVDEDLRAEDVIGPFTMMRAVRQLVEDHRTGRENRLRYIIYEGTIWSASWGWTAREYTGTNPHDHHAHYDGSYETAKENDTSPWNIGFVEGPMDINMSQPLPGENNGTIGGAFVTIMQRTGRTSNVDAPAEAARDAAALTRDAAMAAALQAIAASIQAGGGSVDVAAITTHIDSKVSETNAAVESLRATMQAEIDQLQQENADLRTQIGLIPEAVVDETRDRLQD